MVFMLLLLPTLALLVSAAITFFVRTFALQKGILDIPNQRSSHTQATPRGGGLSFVLVFLGFSLLFVWLLPENRALWLALLGGGLVAAVGWLDDRKGLSNTVRFAVHGVAAAWALFWLGGLSQLELGLVSLPLGALGYLFAWLGIVWLINLYNFMDGIDGLAAGQAVVVALAAGAFLLLAGNWQLALACWVLAGATGGFLYWNWPPAKIFMGDVGSGLLGFVFAVFAIQTENRGGMPLLVWAVLLAPFIVDATATLVRRMIQREKWFEAHRSHAYQYATLRGYSHLQVTSSIMLIDAGLVFLSYLAWRWPLLLLPVSLVAVTGLLWLWQHFVRPSFKTIRS